MTVSCMQVDMLRAFIREELDAGGFELPVLPDVVNKVQEAARRPYSTASLLAKLIEADGTIAANVLKIANSARYAGLETVTSLATAIGRLGSDAVVSIVVGAVSKGMFKSSDEKLRSYLKLLWHRSAFASAAARRLSERSMLKPDQAFLGGLMMRLGEPVLIAAAERLVRIDRIPRPAAADVVAAIQPLAPETGARLIVAWKLPEFLAEAVRHQGEPERAAAEHVRAAALLSLSGSISELMLSKLLPSQVKQQLAENRMVGLLHIDPATLPARLMEIASEGRELIKLL